MIIIKRKSKDKEKARWQKQCPKCKTKFEINMSDITTDREYGMYVICPKCSDFVYIGL